MRHGNRKIRRLAALVLLILAGSAWAQGQGPQKDPFRGKLFAPNVILQHQDELGLSKAQFTAIRAAVVDVQGAVAEHEWDLREAYMQAMEDLDESPVDEAKVLESIQAALSAENEVKKLQVGLLIKLRNLLTDEQLAYLQSLK
jgi:Spy/CpxP family protein refolding chaperone